VRILLSDGSGLTARQVAGILAGAGHEVEVLSPDPLALTRCTRHVRRLHRVPPYGADPLLWLDAALAVWADGRFDLLLPTQEQVAVLAACPDRLTSGGVVTVVPEFAALAAVQDKVSAHRTLDRLDLPQPSTGVVPDGDGLRAWDAFPAYVKLPIGTASRGVVRVADHRETVRLADELAADGAFGLGGVVVQAALDGPLVMVQSVFDRGRLVASHVNLRLREGAGGGASHKESVDLPEVRGHLTRLGSDLAWHGALSMDAILVEGHPRYIDVNPRLVEPGNALRSGVDLVGALVDLALGAAPPAQPPGIPGVRTHQALLALLGAARRRRPRRAVLAEATAVVRRDGDYRGSVEELTPLRGDLRAVLPSALAVVAMLVHPPAWRFFASNATTNYALHPDGWQALLALREDTAG
jgi:hypothetical protein